MALETKEILDLLDFQLGEKKIEELTKDDIKSHFNKNFVGLKVAHESEEVKNTINTILGKERGTIASKLKNKFEELGINFDGKGIRDGDRIIIDKVIDVGISESLQTIKTLKEAANHTDDTKLKEVQNKLEKIQSDYQTVISERNTLNETLQKKDQEFEGFKVKTTIDEKVKSAKSKIPFSDTWNDYSRKGFDQAFFEKYDIELSTENDSEDGLRIVDKKTKQRIGEGNKFLTFEALYKKELADAKGLKLSNNEPKPPQKTFTYNQEPGKEVKLNPKAAAIAAGQKI